MKKILIAAAMISAAGCAIAIPSKPKFEAFKMYKAGIKIAPLRSVDKLDAISRLTNNNPKISKFQKKP